MTQEEFNKLHQENEKDLIKSIKKRNLHEIVAHPDFENVTKQLKKCADNYTRYLKEKEIKMNKLFDKENVVTVITSDRVKVGDKGYFGQCIYELEEAVKDKKLASIEEIREGRADCYCFLNSADEHVYELFLPEDKVNLDALNFRPLKNIKELFAFMVSTHNTTNNYTTDEMISMLLGRRYVIKDKSDGTVRYHVVNFLSVSAHGTVVLDYFDLKFLFENYEFKRGDTFVPFGVKE